MAEDSNNTIVSLKKWLGTKERPVSTQEMSEFWASLTEAEKLEFKTTPLK
jgi:hypothetical protein